MPVVDTQLTPSILRQDWAQDDGARIPFATHFDVDGPNGMLQRAMQPEQRPDAAADGAETP